MHTQKNPAFCFSLFAFCMRTDGRLHLFHGMDMMLVKTSNITTATVALLLASCVVNGATVQGILLNLSALDKHVSSMSIIQKGSVDTFIHDGEELGICNLVHFMPYIFMEGKERMSMSRLGVTEGSLGVFLAAHHLNSDDGSIVPAVEGLNKWCNIHFTVENLDSERNPRPAVDKMIGLLNRVPGKDQLPCAILGNVSSDVTMATSLLSGLAGYPQVSPLTSGSQLDDKSQFPLFGRVIPSSDGVAIPSILFFDQVLNVQHVAIVHFNDGYGNAYASAMQRAAQQYAPYIVLKVLDMPRTLGAKEIAQAISIAKDTKFRYFFSLLGDAYEPVMEEAYR